MSYLKHAREVARACTNRKKREMLLARIEEFALAFAAFSKSVSRDDMVSLNGAWTRLYMALRTIDPVGGDGSSVGRAPIPKQAVA